MHRRVTTIHDQPQPPRLQLRLPYAIASSEPRHQVPATVVFEGDQFGPTLVVGPLLAQSPECGATFVLRLEASDQISDPTARPVMQPGEEEQTGTARQFTGIDLQLLHQGRERNLDRTERRGIAATCRKAQDASSFEVLDAHLRGCARGQDVLRFHATIVVPTPRWRNTLLLQSLDRRREAVPYLPVRCRPRATGGNVASYLEVWKREGPELVPLDADRITIGSHVSNDVVLSADRTVSRLHAVLEAFPAGWSLRDMGSRNGTFVNGRKLSGERLLAPGDEVRIGRTRLVLRGSGHGEHTTTEAAQPAPVLTRRERDVLVALCRPVLSGDVFTEPASIRAVAAELVVSEAAVKQHLLNLYDKFAIYGVDNRRLELANQAIRRGAVSIADLRRPPPSS